MVNAMSSAQGLNNAGSVYLAQQIQALGGSTPLGGLTGGQAAGGASQRSATIYGPGQLLSNLQQLETQNPAEFKQIVSQIASQLQTAAQQTQGPQSSFLTNLADKFGSVA